jgi:hypothetical protein
MSQAIHNSVDPAHEAASIPRPIKRQPARDRQLATEGSVEVRLQQLGEEIQDLTDAPYPGLLQDRDYVREALEELNSKHTTLLWTARVAKCTNGFVRERLWWDIEKALASLERMADSLVGR